MTRRPAHEPELLVKVALAALVGAGLAALVVRSLWSLDPPVLGVLVLAAVVFCVLVVARRSPAPQPATRPAPQRVYQPSQPAQPAQPAAFSWGQPAPATANGGAPRWHPGAAPAETSAAQPTPAETSAAQPAPADPARPVATAALSVRDGTRVPVAAAASARAVQCPRCGDFGVDVARRAPGFAFRCRCCDADWQWRPGAAWPVSVVRPRAAGRPAARPGLRPT
jgi:hypothetical protein